MSEEESARSAEPESSPKSLTETSLRPSELGQADVFISYSRKDVARVRELEEELVSWGVGVWKDTEDIAAASSWSEEIVHAIRGCKVFLLLCSARSFESGNVANEVALATSSKRVLLPVYLEPIEEVPASFAYQLSRIQHVQYFGEHADKALADIRKCLRRHDITVKGRKGRKAKVAGAVGSPGKWPEALRGRASKVVLGVAAALVVLAVGVKLWPGSKPANAASNLRIEADTSVQLEGELVLLRVDGAGPRAVHTIPVEAAAAHVDFGPILPGAQPSGLNGDGIFLLHDDGEYRLELRQGGVARAGYPDPASDAPPMRSKDFNGTVVLEPFVMLAVELPDFGFARLLGNRVEIRDGDDNVVHSIAVDGEPVEFGPLVTDEQVELGGTGRRKPVHLRADEHYRVELRAANGVVLARYPDGAAAAANLSGKVVLVPVGESLSVQVPSDEQLVRDGWTILIRRVDGVELARITGSGAEAAVFEPIVTVGRPTPETDWNQPAGAPIWLGDDPDHRFRVHVYKASDLEAEGDAPKNGRFYRPGEGVAAWKADVLLDQSQPLELEEYRNPRFGNE